MRFYRIGGNLVPPLGPDSAILMVVEVTALRQIIKEAVKLFVSCRFFYLCKTSAEIVFCAHRRDERGEQNADRCQWLE